MRIDRKPAAALLALILLMLACSPAFLGGNETEATPTALRPTATSVLPRADSDDPNEPVVIHGEIPFTSPFFINTIAEPFVLLEDEAGFVTRDREFEFPLAGQAIGPVEIIDDTTLRYTLPLPAAPQATLVDVDNDGEEDTGLMVFAVAYWSNTWGGPFLEPRDGHGWSTAYTSAITDPDNEDEIKGGTLLIWAPDDQQAFPTGFGDDGLLFTDDDPTASVPPGYSLVDLEATPFRVYKEPQPEITLIEGEIAVNDFSDMDFGEAFEALFDKVAREYPFTDEKVIDWDALRDEYVPRAAAARNNDEYYRAVRDFTYAIPDAHVGVSFNAQVFFEEQGGALGMVLEELDDGTIVATEVLPALPAADAGIERGAEIVRWDGMPAGQALDGVQPYFGPYSTEHHRRRGQLQFLPRGEPGSRVEITFRNPGGSEQTVTLTRKVDYDSLFLTLAGFQDDELALPVEGQVLDESGLGYVVVRTFSGDYNLLARLWEAFIDRLIEGEIPGLILDLRENGGGNGALARDFAGYFFDEEIILSQRSYYNDRTGEFELRGLPSRLEPAPLLYEGPLAVLVSPDCISACEGFVHALTQGGRAIVVGHFPTSGAFGEVGRGQYDLPADLSLQFPTGRPETPDGRLLIEGEGITPDIIVPVTAASALGEVDAVLEAAITALLQQVRR